MATVATKPMTAEEFYEWANLPENRDRHFELEEGEIVEMSLPGERHGLVCGNFAGILGNYTRQIKKGYVCLNVGLIIERNPATVRGADVTLTMENRKFEDLEIKYPERMPILAVEVLSPNDRHSKLTRRISQFLSKGVAMVWVADPEDRTITVHRPNELPVVFEENEDLTGFDLLPGFTCKVAEFFVVPG